VNTPRLLPLAVRYARDGLVGRALRRPMFLTVFVTARCPLACGHCFYRGERDAASAADELTLTELRVLAGRLPPVPKLILTGGEPLLRDDVAAIVAAFHDGRSRCRQVTIPTAGVFPRRTAELVERVLSTRPELVLEIQLSIDGVGQQHDAIRGAGTFERLVETFERLRRVVPQLPGLSIRFNFTFSRVTQEHFGDVLQFVTEDLGHPQLDMVLVRKTTADERFWGGVDLDRYRDAAAKLQRLEVARAGRSPLRRALTGRVRREREIIAEHHRGNRVLDGCLAGTVTGVIGETGEVYPCEILDRPLGNLRDVDFDFMRIWHGERARECRRWIRREGCFCTFETGVRTTLSLRARGFQ
jgi:MoaA/NifB/PqqE/SkfB family radical SAM enzyme